ncbi:MAG: hypothetical protein V3T86_05270 [Planctomycetota bacterium]
MTRNSLSATLLFVTLAPALISCTSRNVGTPMPEPGNKPDIEQRTLQIYEVVDEMSRQRLGYVEKKAYGSGRILYWVYGVKRANKLGYVEENGRAYRYQWDRALRKMTEKEFPADSHAIGVRRILDHTANVAMVPRTERELIEALERAENASKKAAAGSAEEEEG